jgi:Ssp1 endopeptidase immunity protein Rap1a
MSNARVGRRRAVLQCVAIAALFTLASGAASAQTVRLEQYRHPPEPKFKNFNQLYLKGVVDGLIAYSAAQDRRNRLFCIPPKVAITVEQAEDIMLRYAEQKQLPGTVPIAVPLLRGLKDAFPCTIE